MDQTSGGTSILQWLKAKKAVSGLLALGAILSTVVVWNASNAAFTSSTSNAANNWQTGTVVIDDDDAGAALFNATNLKPTSTGEKCIVVSYTGSLASAVRLYGSAISSTNSLGDYLRITVEEGTGGSNSDCTGFAADSTLFDANLSTWTATNFSNGLSVWAPTGAASDERTYRFTYTVDTAAPNSVQNSQAAATFTWEAQNT